MIRRRSSWLLGTLVCGVLVAGCGSASSSNSTAASTPATASTSSAATSTPSTGTAGGGGSVQAKEAACKQEVAKDTSLPASIRPKLESACVKVANGDTKAVDQVAREVCELVIKQSRLTGAARAEALTR